MKKKNIDNQDYSHVITIDQPIYNSHPDEQYFFKALKTIRSIKKMVGFNTGTIKRKNYEYITTGLDLYLDKPYLSDNELRKFIAILMRYDIDMSVLQAQLHEKNAHWLKNPKMWWCKKIFGPKSKKQ
jgi:hypothetical protein